MPKPVNDESDLVRITVYVKSEQHEIIKRAAKAAGCVRKSGTANLTEFIRTLLEQHVAGFTNTIDYHHGQTEDSAIP